MNTGLNYKEPQIRIAQILIHGLRINLDLTRMRRRDMKNPHPASITAFIMWDSVARRDSRCLWAVLRP